MDYRNKIVELLSNPEGLKEKEPFTRGLSIGYGDEANGREIDSSVKTQMATLPKYKRIIVTQEQFMKELDPCSHNVLFDENIPAITMKLQDGGFVEIKYNRAALPIQKTIKDKQVLHLTGYPMQFTLLDTKPSEKVQKNFMLIKQYWEKRNMDGARDKMVDVQKSVGDAGLLFYYDYKGRIKCRVLSYADGYILCPHKDENGDHILDSVYYKSNGVEYIDSYDDEYMYRYTNDMEPTDSNPSGWRLHEPVKHGFDEMPLIIKRGKVAWDDAQSLIESKEVLFNIFNVIQKRHGWGMLYIKGKFKDEAKKIAGSIILNDTSIEGKGDAKYLTPPSPQGTIDTLNSLDDEIQKAASTTFLLPKDIKAQGDVSGIAVQLTQSMDIENALRGVIDWQNVADKMCRLFKHGLASELVRNNTNSTAFTDFAEVNMVAKFKVWRPFNDAEFNQMLATLKGSGLISQETGIEVNTISKPDELARVRGEEEEARRLAETQSAKQ